MVGDLSKQVNTWDSLYRAWREAAQEKQGEALLGFLRSTFQEYLVARAAAMASGVDLQPTVERAVRNLEDTAWHEVVRWVAGPQDTVGTQQQAAAALVVAILDAPGDPRARARHAILAGACLVDLGEEGVTVAAWERGITALRHAMQDAAPDGHPNDPPLVPIAARYAAGEVLDRLGWLPPDLDAWVEVQMSSLPSPLFSLQPPTSSLHSRIITVGRYPVTNVQFGRFIAAGGYENPAYWGGEDSKDWRWRVKAHPGYRREGPVTQPEYWDHPRLGQEQRGYPVVGVSWYEATAYCRWLEEQLRIGDYRLRVWRDGQLETSNLPPETVSVRLPAEEEWVTAAGGLEDGRYPWGPKWHASRANTREGGVGGTTPVAMYPSGQSPWGIWDMGGNVWEWTRSADDEAQRRSILRCGSWLDVYRLARVAVRGWYFPAQSYHYVGFRVVVSPANAGTSTMRGSER